MNATQQIAEPQQPQAAAAEPAPYAPWYIDEDGLAQLLF